MVKRVVHFFGLSKSDLRCDGCDERLVGFEDDFEIAYHCWQCKDFDLCKKCYQSQGHPHPIFKKIIKPALNVKFTDNLRTMMTKVFRYYADQPCLGYRRPERDGAPLPRDYEWLTFDHVFDQAWKFAYALHQMGIHPGDIVAICSKNRLEWVVCDLGCLLLGVVTVPIFYTVDTDSLISIVEETTLETVICDRETMDRFLAVGQDHPSLHRVIVMDGRPSRQGIPARIRGIVLGRARMHTQTTQQTHPHNLKVTYLYDMITPYAKPKKKRKSKKRDDEYVPARDRRDEFEERMPLPPPPPMDALFTISYTSGSTGRPKGVMFSQEAFMGEFRRDLGDTVVLCHLPLPHSSRGNNISSLCNGGRVAIFEGPKGRLLEDIALVQPSDFSAPPRFWNKLHEDFNTSINEAMIAQPHTDREVLEQELFAQVARQFGSRMRILSTGSAPTSGPTMHFLRRCFASSCRVVDGYGATEVGGISSNNVLYPSSSVKLVDYEEYTSADKPHPRGEVWVKAPHAAMGYFNNPKDTKAHFVDGWFRTGDIGQLDTNGYLVLVGRVKNIFKLAQGEYVAPERLESVYAQCPIVGQMMIHADSHDEFVVALIVPNENAMSQYKHILPAGPMNLDDLNVCVPLHEAVLREFGLLAERAELHRYEVPRELLFVSGPFTIDNKLLTDTMKPNRRAVVARFQAELDMACARGRGRTVAFWWDDNESTNHNKGEGGAQRTGVRSHTHAKLLELAQGMGMQCTAWDALDRLGCDSLSAARFVHVVKGTFQVDLPITSLYAPERSMYDLARAIDVAITQNSPVFIPPDTSQAPPPPLLDPQVVPPGPGPGSSDDPVMASDVLLTGATGFLGAHLLHELIQAIPNANVYCIVRCDNQASGIERLERVLRSYEIWHDGMKGRVQAVPGDLEAPGLGMTPQALDTMMGTIGSIYHCAAIVNSVKSYEHHQRTNVHGTHELLKLAVINGRMREFHFVSSVSVLHAGEAQGMTSECSLSGVPAPHGGYALSKYRAETLCTEARRRGLRVAIYRPGTIAAHSQTGGCNREAFIHRVVCGLSGMGQYPVAQGGAPYHVEWAPVDYVARAVVALSVHPEVFNRDAYHLVNPQLVPLPSMARALEAAGRPTMQPLEDAAWRALITPDMRIPGAEGVIPHPLFPVLASHLTPQFPNMRAFDDKNTRSLLPPSVACPPVGDDAFAKCLHYCFRQGWLGSNKDNV
eukprot:TRINITY_DN962_c0_g1_i2.p1 TRINITY_DN962_c0_g1~~TRINITY_DN962_c0_g1_i2.p1  ORF type:complete len:1213 (+),score=256.62 TRINITY_DN962_c0_g1_i2:2420-6058(+)